MDESDIAGYKELMGDSIDKESLTTLLEQLMEAYFAERGCLWIEAWGDYLYHGDEELRDEFPFSTQVVEAAVTTGRGFVSFDSKLDDRIAPTGSIAVHKVRSCLCAAARDTEGSVLAVAYFDNKTSAGNFTEEDLASLETIMSHFPGATATPK